MTVNHSIARNTGLEVTPRTPSRKKSRFLAKAELLQKLTRNIRSSYFLFPDPGTFPGRIFKNYLLYSYFFAYFSCITRVGEVLRFELLVIC